MKKLFSAILVVATLQTTVAQNDYNQVNFYPPSSASMMKYIDHPVSPRTGVPDISIPLFTIRSGKLELPLKLTFHIDDYAKVNQLPGAAGAGWALSSDIQVSRSINGLDDLGLFGYLSTGVYWPDYKGFGATRDQTHLYLMYQKQKDEEPDKYYYRLLGNSGSFYLMRQQNGSVVPKAVPMNGVKITRTSGGQFTLIDTDGTEYRFSSSITDECTPSSGVTVDMAWKCDRITNASGTDVITFEYVGHQKSTIKKYTGKDEVYDRIYIRNSAASTALRQAVRGPKHVIYTSRNDSRIEYVSEMDDEGTYFPYWEAADNISDLYSYQEMYINNVSRIRFRGGRADFIYTNNEVLTQIKIYADGQSTPVRTIAFDQTGSGYSRTLKNLTVGKDKYTFAYEGTRQGEVLTNFWGYGAMAGRNGVPYHSVEVEKGPNGTRIDGQPMMRTEFTASIGDQSITDGYHLWGANMLTIKYPTGGLTRFLCGNHCYRSNEGAFAGYVIPVGSPRISQIEYCDTDSTLIKQKVYKYGPNDDGCGVIRREPTFDEEYGTCHTSQEVRYYTPYLGSYSLDATARLRTYLPNMIFQMNYSDGNIVNYKQVTEYNMDMGQQTGKTVYKYNLNNQYSLSNQYADPEAPYPVGEDAWWVGNPDSTIYYKYENGRYEWVKKIAYQHECHMEPYRIFQGRVWQRAIPILIGGVANSTFIQEYSVFDYRTSAIQVGCMQLTQENESVRNDDGSILSKQTRYYYDDAHPYVPGRKETTYSTGETVTEHTLFAEDYLQDSYVQGLRTLNLVALPMEQIVRRNGKVVSGRVHKYDLVGRMVDSYMLEADNLSETLFRLSNKNAAGDFNIPATTAYSPDSHYQSKASVLYDANGNICEVYPSGKCPVCYLWGYNGQYLIAEIRNATYANVKTWLGSALVDRVRTATTPSASDLTQINNLRNNADLQVTTATYRPLYGMASQTDPDGRTESYVYNDTTGRLLRVIDGDGHVQTEYSYSQDQ